MASTTDDRTAGAALSDAKRALLERLRAGTAAPAAPRIPAVPDGAAVKLSLAQERIWLTSRLAADTAAFNLVAAVRIARAVRPSTVRTNVERARRRNDSMRMVVELVDGVPHLRVSPDAEVPVTVTDLSAAVDPSADADAAVRAFAERSYDLCAGPLWRVALFRLAPDDHLLALGAHHLVSDGDSLALAMEQIATGEAAPDATVAYRDFAAWEREQDHRGAFGSGLSHWRTRLADLPPPLELPADRPPPSSPDYAGTTITRAVDATTSRRLTRLGAEEGATSYAVVFAAYAALLGRLARQNDLIVGTPVSRRAMSELRYVVGLLINILPVRVQLRAGESFRDLVGRVGPMLASDQAHADVPYERLVRSMRRPGGTAQQPLVQVGFNMPTQRAFGAPGDGLGPGAGEDVLATPVTPSGAQLDLTVHVLAQSDGPAVVQMEYATARFDDATAHRVLGWYVHLLERVAAEPDAAYDAVPLHDVAVRAQLVGLGDATATAPRPLLPSLIARQIEDRADHLAVEDGTARCTYGQLGARVDALAGALSAAGVGRGDVVALSMRRSVALQAAILATWRVGAAFLPIDGDLPLVRQQAIVDAARPAALLADRPAVLGALDVTGAPVVDVHADHSDPPPAVVTLRGDDAAYVMFTSGSTGTPKGVEVPHGAIANRVCWTLDNQGVGAHDRVLAKTRVGFDAAVLEWTVPLAAGGVTVMAGPGVERDPAALLAAVAASRATVVQTVPSVLRLLVDAPGWPDDGVLRQVWLAGEPLDERLVRRLRERTNAAVWNTYGPTECAVDVTGYEVLAYGADADALPHGLVPIGRPLAGVRVVLVDAGGEPVPVGVAGDLLVGGVAISHGYVGRPDLTADRFVPDPFGAPGARLYRTGDLARWRADGVLEFLGRVDDQVKINGVRTEPAEVAAALAGIAGVQGAYVTPWRPGGADGTRLVAYVVADGEVEPAALRRQAAERLPAAMVPSQFVVLDVLPLNVNGKVDRRALPSPDADASRPEHVPARTVTERTVVMVWREVLDVGRVGRHDDFFAAGGHSLLLTRVQHRLSEELGKPVPLRMLFDATTVAALAAAIDSAPDATDVIVRVPRDEPLSLSFAQTRWWFQDRLHPGSLDHVIPLFIPLSGDVDERAIAATLTALAARHEILRTRYVARGGQPWQVVDPPGPVPLAIVDIAAGELEDHVVAELRRPFDLARGPVWRAMVLRGPDEPPLLLLTMHHIASDGWSTAVLRDEFATVHDRLARDGVAPSGPAPIQYADFAAWQRRRFDAGEVSDDLAHWRATLAALPPLELPTDRPRPVVHDPRGARVTRRIPAQVTAAVLAVGGERGATPFMTFLAGFVTLLARSTGQDDIAVGTPVAGRSRPELADALGCFINTLVLRFDLTSAPTFGAVLDRVRRTTLDAFAHADVPFERLVADLAPDRDMSRFPLFGVQFDLQDAAYAGDTFEERGRDAPATVRQDLALTLRLEDDGSTSLVVRYPVALFDVATVERFVDHYERLLDEAAASPEVRIDALPLAPVPAADTDARVVVLDGGMRPTVDGIVGDVYERGPDLRPAPSNEPVTIAERLVPDPAGQPGSRMLRTGRRARRVGQRVVDVDLTAGRRPSGAVDGAARGAVEPPDTPVQERLAQRWSELLGIERTRIGIRHGFFQLGGHSLLAVQLLAVVAEDFEVTLPLQAVFEEPTIAGLAARIEAAVEAEIASMSDAAVAAALETGDAPA